METITKEFVGVDVSKAHLDIHIHPAKKVFRIKNDKDGLKSLHSILSKHEIEQVVCEASGGYENPMLKFIAQKGYKTWRVDPRRIKAFIASEGVKAKTDAIDAKMIALFASQKSCSYVPNQKSEQEEELTALIKERSDLVDLIATEMKRSHQASDGIVQKFIQKRISFMKKQIKKLESIIDKLIKANAELKNKLTIAESMPGVGRVTATTILAYVPELGTVDSKQAAALVGVAPYTKQSGAFKGHASISGGRSAPRRVLFMAALTAAKHNSKFKEFYERLIKCGKKPMVALVALMRKIVVILNAMFRDGKLWETC